MSHVAIRPMRTRRQGREGATEARGSVEEAGSRGEASGAPPLVPNSWAGLPAVGVNGVFWPAIHGEATVGALSARRVLQRANRLLRHDAVHGWRKRGGTRKAR